MLGAFPPERRKHSEFFSSLFRPENVDWFASVYGRRFMREIQLTAVLDCRGRHCSYKIFVIIKSYDTRIKRKEDKQSFVILTTDSCLLKENKPLVLIGTDNYSFQNINFSTLIYYKLFPVFIYKCLHFGNGVK